MPIVVTLPKSLPYLCKSAFTCVKKAVSSFVTFVHFVVKVLLRNESSRSQAAQPPQVAAGRSPVSLDAPAWFRYRVGFSPAGPVVHRDCDPFLHVRSSRC